MEEMFAQCTEMMEEMGPMMGQMMDGGGMMGGMMDGMMGSGMMATWMILSWILLLALVVAVALAIVWMMRRLRPAEQPIETPYMILKRRYAAGEIDAEQFEKMKYQLGGSQAG